MSRKRHEINQDVNSNSTIVEKSKHHFVIETVYACDLCEVFRRAKAPGDVIGIPDHSCRTQRGRE